jgi:hypothetical protein
MPKSQPSLEEEGESGGDSLIQTGGSKGWKLWFSARPIQSIVCTNSKTPDNKGVFNGFTFFFVSQKQTVSATHRYATVSPVRFTLPMD